MEQNGKTRVAIIGGGLGAMGAALGLTATEALRERFEVTIYCHGWRLGGKGASGRDPDEGFRIEEHGLHIFLGFYETAFRAMRQCYFEWDKPAAYAFQSWHQAFTPLSQAALTQQVPSSDKAGHWETWLFEMPLKAGQPWQRKMGAGIDLVGEMLDVLTRWLELHRDTLPDDSHARGRALIDAAAKHHLAAGGVLQRLELGLLRGAIDGVQFWLRALTPALLRTPSGYEFACVADFGLAMLKGYVTDVLPYGPQGFYRINGEEYKDWLARHGLSELFHWSAPVRQIYDLAFAYVGGDSMAAPTTAQMAAGSAAEVVLLMFFGYPAAAFYRMMAGMGDTVFTPIYHVLKQRGVRIELFHRVAAIETDASGAMVQRLRVNRQVDLKAGSYDPFIPVPYGDGSTFLYCWPKRPLWDQIADGETVRQKCGDLESAYCDFHVAEFDLVAGRDFDKVVLAVPPATLENIARPLIAANPRFAQMVAGSSAVCTQSAQLWFRTTLQELGWTSGPVLLTSFAEPLDSWGDMDQTLPAEQWTVDPPRAVQYLCGVAPFPQPPYLCGYGPGLARGVGETTQQWLDAYAQVIWPAYDSTTIRSVYFRFNLDPSERYVLSLPGSIDSRLTPGDSGFANAVLAGDWTFTWYCAGSAESAILSGKQAAEALTGFELDLMDEATISASAPGAA